MIEEDNSRFTFLNNAYNVTSKKDDIYKVDYECFVEFIVVTERNVWSTSNYIKKQFSSILAM